MAPSASPMGEGTRGQMGCPAEPSWPSGCLITLGQAAGQHMSLGLVICRLEMGRKALGGCVL